MLRAEPELNESGTDAPYSNECAGRATRKLTSAGLCAYMAGYGSTRPACARGGVHPMQCGEIPNTAASWVTQFPGYNMYMNVTLVTPV